MDFSNIESSDSRSGRSQALLGVYLLLTGLLLLGIVAFVAHLFDSMKDVLLLRDIVGGTTALPVYVLMLFALGLIARGLLTMVVESKSKLKEPGSS